MEKFELLLTVLKALKDAGALNHLTLVGSWCLDVYRNIFPENTSIPATRTMDADILIPRRFPRGIKIDVPRILEEIGFITHVDYPSGFHRFVHPELNLEFLTHAGAKSSLKASRLTCPNQKPSPCTNSS